MCYFLYGAINGGINTDDYDSIIKNSTYHFNTGNHKNVNACVENHGNNYRITRNYCDCDTPIGNAHKNKTELKEFADLLIELKHVRGIKHIMFSKNWYGDINKEQQTLHVDDIDVLDFLANVKDNCLYKIELYPKYY